MLPTIFLYKFSRYEDGQLPILYPEVQHQSVSDTSILLFLFCVTPNILRHWLTHPTEQNFQHLYLNGYVESCSSSWLWEISFKIFPAWCMVSVKHNSPLITKLLNSDADLRHDGREDCTQSCWLFRSVLTWLTREQQHNISLKNANKMPATHTVQ